MAAEAAAPTRKRPPSIKSLRVTMTLLRSYQFYPPRHCANAPRAWPCCIINDYFMKALLESLQAGERDWELAQAIDPARLPAHIAVIMDGNGRWARRRRLPRIAGHKAGTQAVRDVVESCSQLGLTALSLYAFSAENWKRPKREIDTLMDLLREYIRRELAEIHRNNIRLKILGHYEQLP